jgi:hypothetical protein
MRFFQALFIGSLLFVAAPAFAEKACYAPEHTRAEHLLRLHSELMVITASCHYGTDGQYLPDLYAIFTRKNIRALHGAEQTMMAYYKTTTKNNPVDRLDRLRTRLGNEFGQKMARMSAPEFCAQYRDKVAQMNIATFAELESYVRRMEIAERTYIKPCDRAVVAKKKK